MTKQQQRTPKEIQRTPMEMLDWKISGRRLADSPDGRTFFTAEEIKKAMDSFISARSARIISLRYGLEDGDPKTLREIGAMEEFCLTGNRIMQIEKKALSDLRQALYGARGRKPHEV